MITPLSHSDFATMHVAGKVAAGVLKDLEKIIKPGITTKDIEKFFDNELEKYPGMEAAFRGINGYPASLCVSVNEEIIHGIPSDRVIAQGDVVSVDLGIKYKGLFVDTAFTYIAGDRPQELGRKMIKVAYDALIQSIQCVKIGARIGDIGSTVQKIVESNKFSVIRKFVGHGIGRSLHSYPEVPNFGRKNEGELLEEGMAIAIEPMVAAGSYDIEVLNDGWTVKTKDNSLAVHFEHTVAITEKGPWVITQLT